MNKLHEFTRKDRLSARRGTNAVEPGTVLYAIQDVKTNMYFIWCYTNKAFAERMLTRINIGSDVDRDANWRYDLDDLVHSDRKDF